MLSLAGVALTGLAMVSAAWAVAAQAPLPLPDGGRRAIPRRRALSRSRGFALCDSSLRRLAALTSPLWPAGARSRLDRWLAEAGYPLGLEARELGWVAVMLALVGALVGQGYGRLLGHSQLAVSLGLGLGLSLPFLRAQGARERRFRQIAHALPAAIDLCALCMGAGLDFAAAIEVIVEQAPDPDDALIQELQHMLRALRLGTTRERALAQLGEAAPIASVGELVAAVQQGERKGTPLAQTLAVQAQLLRRRRSLVAEEAAARAAVMLVLPLLLLVGCVMVLLFAPFAVNGFGL